MYLYILHILFTHKLMNGRPMCRAPPLSLDSVYVPNIEKYSGRDLKETFYLELGSNDGDSRAVW